MQLDDRGWSWRLAGLLLLAWGWGGVACGHPLPSAQATMFIKPDGSYELYVSWDIAASVMQAPPGHLGEELAQALETMPLDQLEERVAEARHSFTRRLNLRFDEVEGEPLRVEFPTADELRAGDVSDRGRKPRVAQWIGITPPGAQHCTLTFPKELQQVVLIVMRADDSTSVQILADGESSTPVELGLTGRNALRRAAQTAGEYLLLGIEHIVPKGLDHILFVLGLFLLSPRWSSLLWQVTAFTVAHSVTLALAMFEVVTLPGEVVEPLIALSIVVIGVENLLTVQVKAWRLGIVFLFGLLHGLGFAGVLGELGLPRDAMLVALVSFNVGVELGQLLVIGLAALAVGWWRQRPGYRSWVVIPGSLAIAVVGAYWTIERLGWLGE